MNKKNGFTLVELLTVITIIGAIIVFIIAANMGILSGSKKKIEELAMKQFIDGAKLFLADIDNGLYGYTFATEGEYIGSFTYPSKNFRVMLENSADESTVGEASFSTIAGARTYFATHTLAGTVNGFEVDNYGGQTATACLNGSVIMKKMKDGKIEDVYIWCQYRQLDNVLTHDVNEGSFANVKIVKLTKCQERHNPGTIIGGQTGSSTCTQLNDSYFESATVQYLPGNMIYGYEARLYMNGTFKDANGRDHQNSFVLTAEYLSSLGYYVDGKCTYGIVEQEKKCRVPKETRVYARIKTEKSSGGGSTYISSSGYEATIIEKDSDLPTPAHDPLAE